LTDPAIDATEYAPTHWPKSKGAGRKGGATVLLSSLYLKIRELLHRDDEEEGQGMVEYALILVLIAIVVIVVLIILGNQVKNVFCNISTGLGR
jgi:pilus assembly protein Flp/PilA